MNVPVHMLDEERRSGFGNELQDPVWLRFSLYQGANWHVLNGASYRGRRSDIALTSKPRANRRSPLASAFNGPANSVAPLSSGKASMSCRAVHSAVGCAVTLKWMTNVNASQIQAVCAWYFRRYSADVPKIESVQYEAAKAKAR